MTRQKTERSYRVDGGQKESMGPSSSKSDGFGGTRGENPEPVPRSPSGTREQAAWQEMGETNVVAPADPQESTPLPETSLTPAAGVRMGDYHLLEKLGEGAMGAVYRAVQLSFDRVVALKIL